MHWIYTALTTYFIWAVLAIIDKIFLSNKFCNYELGYTALTGVIGMFSTLILTAYFGVFIPSAQNIMFNIGSGLLFSFGVMLHNMALSIEDASVIIPLRCFTSVFTLLFSYFLFGRTLNAIQFLAFVFFVLGAFLVSIKSKKKLTNLFTLRKSIIFTIFANILYALSYLLQKSALDTGNFWNKVIWIRFSVYLGLLIFFFHPKARRDVLQIFKQATFLNKWIYVLAQFVSFGSYILISYTFTLRPVALINAFEGTQYIFLFILVVLLSKIAPNLYQEELNRPIIIRKTIAFTLISIGIMILSLT